MSMVLSEYWSLTTTNGSANTVAWSDHWPRCPLRHHNCKEDNGSGDSRVLACHPTSNDMHASDTQLDLTCDEQ